MVPLVVEAHVVHDLARIDEEVVIKVRGSRCDHKGAWGQPFAIDLWEVLRTVRRSVGTSNQNFDVFHGLFFTVDNSDRFELWMCFKDLCGRTFCGVFLAPRGLGLVHYLKLG